MEDRERHVDLDKLSHEEQERLGDQIGAKLRMMIDKTCEDANKFLAVYGMQVKMAFNIEPLNTETEQVNGEE